MDGCGAPGTPARCNFRSLSSWQDLQEPPLQAHLRWIEGVRSAAMLSGVEAGTCVQGAG